MASVGPLEVPGWSKYTRTSVQRFFKVRPSATGGLKLPQARRDPRALRQALGGALALIATFRATP